jgi:hypothetical protein
VSLASLGNGLALRASLLEVTLHRLAHELAGCAVFLIGDGLQLS